MLSNILGYTPEEGELLGNTNIAYHPSMDVMDSTKIQSFLTSPRTFFYQYILGWRLEVNSVHLGFGSGWHDAMETLLIEKGTEGYTKETVGKAFMAFMRRWREEYPSVLQDNNHASKNPDNALLALAEYAERWDMHDIRSEVLATEIVGTVPIDDDRYLTFKMDSILKDHLGRIFSLEHKTTSRDSPQWADQWDVIVQPMLYTHALRAHFDPEGVHNNVRGVVINGAVLRKSGNLFKRLPVSKNDKSMIAHIWALNHWWSQIEWNWKMLLDCKESDEVMMAFPCNGTSCSHGYGCAFSSYCAHHPNPLQQVHNRPARFDQKYWDPNREDSVKHIMSITPDGSTFEKV